MGYFNEDDLAKIRKQKEDDIIQAQDSVNKKERDLREAISSINHGLLEFPNAAVTVGLEPQDHMIFRGLRIEYIKGWQIFNYSGLLFIVCTDGRCFTCQYAYSKPRYPKHGGYKPAKRVSSKVVFYENERISIIAEELAKAALLKDPSSADVFFTMIFSGKQAHSSDSDGQKYTRYR